METIPNGISTAIVNGSSISLNTPSGLNTAIAALVGTEKLVIVVGLCQLDNRDWTTLPSGFSLARADQYSRALVRAAVKVIGVGAVEPASYTFGSSGSNDLAGVLAVFSGLEGTINIAGGASNTSGSTSIIVPSITTTVDFAELVIIAGVEIITTFTPTAPLVEVIEVASNECTVFMGTVTAGMAMATDTFTITMASGEWAVSNIAFNPFIAPNPNLPFVDFVGWEVPI